MLIALSLCALLFLEDPMTVHQTSHTKRTTNATDTPTPKNAKPKSSKTAPKSKPSKTTRAKSPTSTPNTGSHDSKPTPHAPDTHPSAPDPTQSTPSPQGKAYKKRKARAHAKAEEQRQTQRDKMQVMPVLNPHAAGIDLGLSTHWVCVGFTTEPNSDLIREFPTHTEGLRQLADFLRQHQVTTVALEATGVYWVATLELLVKEGFDVRLVAPKYTSQVQGRPKTDRLDCQWIYRLHSVGLLPAAFRPNEAVCVLRSYLRHRANIIRAAAKEIQHMQKALEQMNLKLTTVLDDITGVTGQAILKAILKGTRDGHKLAKLRHPHCKSSAEDIARALDGSYRDDHLLVLRQSFEAWQFHQKQLDKLDPVIAQQLERMKRSEALPPLPPLPRKKQSGGRKPNDLRFDAREALYQVLGIDLTELEGFRASTALTLISEIGTDLSAFATVKHFCSWLGLCPQFKKTGGRVKSSKTRAGQSRAASTLRLAASSLHSSPSGLGAYLRRMKSRLGAPAAVTATAHKLARLVYYALKHGMPYVRQTQEEYEKQLRVKQITQLQKKARQLGLEVKEKTEPSGAESPGAASSGAASSGGASGA